MLVLIAQASSEGSDEPAHSRSLVRAFVARTHNDWMQKNDDTKRLISSVTDRCHARVTTDFTNMCKA